MTPYYDDGRVVIYHGDCRDVLPELQADVVLTDLPYGVGVGYDTYEDSPANLDRLIGTTLPLMLAAAPVVALTCGVANVWRYPPPTWMVAWYQRNAFQSTGRWGFNMWQPVLVWGTDPYLARGLGRRPDVVTTVSAITRDGPDHVAFDHPCPKPMDAWKPILARVSPAESDVIVDPMMGSGTTLVAAKYTGRRAVGVEVSEHYCEVAANRLAQTTLDFDTPTTTLQGDPQTLWEVR